VNVYRLITRDTLEEKIMGLQRFKVPPGVLRQNRARGRARGPRKEALAAAPGGAA